MINFQVILKKKRLKKRRMWDLRRPYRGNIKETLSVMLEQIENSPGELLDLESDRFDWRDRKGSSTEVLENKRENNNNSHILV